MEIIKLRALREKTQKQARMALLAAMQELFDGAKSIDCVDEGWQVTATRTEVDGYHIHLRCVYSV